MKSLPHVWTLIFLNASHILCQTTRLSTSTVTMLSCCTSHWLSGDTQDYSKGSLQQKKVQHLSWMQSFIKGFSIWQTAYLWSRWPWWLNMTKWWWWSVLSSNKRRIVETNYFSKPTIERHQNSISTSGFNQTKPDLVIYWFTIWHCQFKCKGSCVWGAHTTSCQLDERTLYV